MTELFDPDRPPWAPGSRRLRFSGTVVDAEGAPIAGAELELVYLGNPHWPEDVAGHATSDAAGRFELGEVGSGGYSLVARHGGMTRTLDLPWPDSDPPPVTVRLVETRPLRVGVRCRERPDAARYDPRRLESIELFVHSPPDGELFAHVALSARDAQGARPARESRLRPDRMGTLASSPLAARRFGVDARVPRGPVRLTVVGGCGVATRTLEIDEGADPLAWELELPADDHATLELRLAPESTRDRVFPRVSLGPLPLRHPYELRRDAPIRLRRLPPGEVSIAGVTCHRPVEVAPSTTTHVTIGPGRCDVDSSAP